MISLRLTRMMNISMLKGSEADGECEWILPSGERKRSEGVW